MSDEKNVIKASLVNVEIPESVDNAAKNLSGPPTESAGQFFKDVIDLVTGPFHSFVEKKRLNWQFGIDQLKVDLQKRLDQTPEEKRTVPDLQIAAQAIQDSVFCVESEELRKMFVNLLASSVNTDKVDDVHPSFSGIIRRMTPNDARVLLRFKKQSRIPIAKIQFSLKRGHAEIEEDVMDPLSPPQESISVSRSLEILQSVGLVRLDYSNYLIADGIYSEFERHPMILSKESLLPIWQATNPDIKGIEYKRGIADLTSLGKQFLKVCT